MTLRAGCCSVVRLSVCFMTVYRQPAAEDMEVAKLQVLQLLYLCEHL